MLIKHDLTMAIRYRFIFVKQIMMIEKMIIFFLHTCLSPLEFFKAFCVIGPQSFVDLYAKR